ncbi:hypothetical protein AOLI_G00010630 [Acnodon oligacanthus]
MLSEEDWEFERLTGAASLPRPVESHGKGGALSYNFHCEQRPPEPGRTSETPESPLKAGDSRGNPAPVESGVWEDGMDPHHRLSVTTGN